MLFKNCAHYSGDCPCMMCDKDCNCDMFLIPRIKLFHRFPPLKKYGIFYHKDIKQILHKNYTKKYFEEILTENGYLAYNNTDYIAICFSQCRDIIPLSDK